MENANVRTARGANSIVVQSCGHVRANGNPSFHAEEIGRKHLGPDVFPRECNFDEIVQIVAEKLDFQAFTGPRAQWKNGTHGRSQIRQGGVGGGDRQHK